MLPETSLRTQPRLRGMGQHLLDVTTRKGNLLATSLDTFLHIETYELFPTSAAGTNNPST